MIPPRGGRRRSLGLPARKWWDKRWERAKIVMQIGEQQDGTEERGSQYFLVLERTDPGIPRSTAAMIIASACAAISRVWCGTSATATAAKSPMRSAGLFVSSGRESRRCSFRAGLERPEAVWEVGTSSDPNGCEATMSSMRRAAPKAYAQKAKNGNGSCGRCFAISSA